MYGFKTADWYIQSGWQQINFWISELAAKNCEKVYIENFDIVPTDANKAELCSIFNEDTSCWTMKIEYDEETHSRVIVCEVKKQKNKN